MPCKLFEFKYLDSNKFQIQILKVTQKIVESGFDDATNRMSLAFL